MGTLLYIDAPRLVESAGCFSVKKDSHVNSVRVASVGIGEGQVFAAMLAGARLAVMEVEELRGYILKKLQVIVLVRTRMHNAREDLAEI